MACCKIAAAQVPSLRGDVERNLATHAAAIRAAGRQGVSLLVFGELSLTGYEPDLAAALAIEPTDPRLASLVVLAREHGLTAIVGAPLANGTAKPWLGAIVIGGDVRTYRKMHLGSSEREFFTAGDEPTTVSTPGHTVGLAICADASQPSHPETYAALGADVYAAGVFLNAEWYAADAPRFSGHAARWRMLTVMANHAASVGTLQSVGKSAIWGPNGALLVQAAGTETALLIAARTEAGWHGEILLI